MDLDVIVEIDPRARRSANSQSSAGKAMRASRSIVSNSSRRLRPRLRMGRSFMRAHDERDRSFIRRARRRSARVAAQNVQSRRI